MSIRKEVFGATKDGQTVTKYTMTNGQGASVSLLDLGAVIQQITVPDREGKLEDVALGYDTVAGYEVNVPSFGAVVGRCANRISDGQFTLGDTTYKLDQNDGTNCLHGGFHRFNYNMYDAECEPGAEEDSISFSRVSPDGEQGFPGNLMFTVSYTWNDANELLISYHAVSDADTILNVTNHCYFNISPGGEAAGSVLSQEVQVASDRYTPTGPLKYPTGEIKEVTGTPMDLREFCSLEERIGEEDPANGTIFNYDHNYLVDTEPGNIVYAGAARDPKNGRLLEVFTDMPGVQLYTARELQEANGKHGRTYGPCAGLCFEAQQYPNGINEPNFPSPVLRAGEEFESVTVYRFSVY